MVLDIECTQAHNQRPQSPNVHQSMPFTTKFHVYLFCCQSLLAIKCYQMLLLPVQNQTPHFLWLFLQHFSSVKAKFWPQPLAHILFLILSKYKVYPAFQQINCLYLLNTQGICHQVI